MLTLNPIVQHVQLILARVGVERGIFEALTEAGSTLSTAAIAQKTVIDPVLASMSCTVCPHE